MTSSQETTTDSLAMIMSIAPKFQEQQVSKNNNNNNTNKNSNSINNNLQAQN